jgi:DNA-binding response OmpR family regulator
MATSGQLPEPRGRILVVDDDPAIRVFLTDFLKQENFEVSAVASGSVALKTFHTEHFDLILVDFLMPGLTGLEVAAAIRKSDPQVPIALMTGTASDLEADDIIQAGVNRTFPKPFDLGEMSSWIASLQL